MTQLSGQTSGGHAYLLGTDPPDLPGVSLATAQSLDAIATTAAAAVAAAQAAAASAASAASGAQSHLPFRRLTYSGTQLASTWKIVPVGGGAADDRSADATVIDVNGSGQIIVKQAGIYHVRFVITARYTAQFVVRHGSQVRDAMTGVTTPNYTYSNTEVYSTEATFPCAANDLIDLLGMDGSGTANNYAPYYGDNDVAVAVGGNTFPHYSYVEVFKLGA